MNSAGRNRHRIRYLLAMALCAAASAAVWRAGMLRSDSEEGESLTADSRFETLEKPIDIRPNGVPGAVDRARLRVAVESLKPRFDRKRMGNTIPVSFIVHALRLWGQDAEFQQVTGKESSGPSLISGAVMRDALLDNRQFLQVCRFRASALLKRSEHGIRAISSHDGAYGDVELLPHPGKLVQVMGEIGVSASASIIPVDGDEGKLSDVVRDDAARVARGMELEFLAQGLARYALSSRSWTNRFGDAWNFDRIADSLLAISPGQGACGGTHVPQALVVLLRSDEQRRLLSVTTRRRIQQYLAALSEALERSQTAEGAWPWNWPATYRGGSVTTPPDAYKAAGIADLVATGHHLEWIALAPDDCRPSRDSIRLAARYLLINWNEIIDGVRRDWHQYYPATHAARALCLLSDLPDAESALETNGATAGARRRKLLDLGAR